MADILHLKKVFLITMIISLILAALIGVVIFLIGNFSEVEMRILGTTASITIYSLIGLFFSWISEKGKMKYFPLGGLILTIFAFVCTVMLIWELNGEIIATIWTVGSYFVVGMFFYWLFERKTLRFFSGGGLILTSLAFVVRFLNIWDLIDMQLHMRLFGAIFIIGFSLLHISLLWLAKNGKLIVDVSLFFTIGMVCIVGGFLVFLVLFYEEIELGELFFRTLGAFAILDGVGTVVTLIVRKVGSLYDRDSGKKVVKK